MEYLEPVTSDQFLDLPGGATKYAEMIGRLQKLKDNEWLPMKFADNSRARIVRDNIMSAMRQGTNRRPFRVQSAVRGNVVYLREIRAVK